MKLTPSLVERERKMPESASHTPSPLSSPRCASQTSLPTPHATSGAPREVDGAGGMRPERAVHVRHPSCARPRSSGFPPRNLRGRDDLRRGRAGVDSGLRRQQHGAVDGGVDGLLLQHRRARRLLLEGRCRGGRRQHGDEEEDGGADQLQEGTSRNGQTGRTPRSHSLPSKAEVGRQRVRVDSAGFRTFLRPCNTAACPSTNLYPPRPTIRRLEHRILELWSERRTFDRLRDQNRGGRALLLHRRSDHREQPDGRPPRLGPHAQGPLPALPRDARLRPALPERVRLPGPVGRGRGREGAAA